MSEKILCVDDEPLVLDGLKRCLHERFCIDTATSADAALNLIDTQGPYAVVVSDLRMPGTDGIRFLAMVRQRAPDSVRVMLTGQADFETAIAAVNEGNIFRFLCKPYQGDALVKALTAAHEQYQLVTAERDLLEQTLSGSVRVLTDVLSLVSPAAFGRAQRVRRMVEQMCAQMQIASSWHIQVAAMLSQVGLMALPPEVVEKLHRGQPLSDAEQHMLAEHPEIGRDLVGNIPRLQEVADIIACQERHFDGSGEPPDGRTGAQIPLGARILKVVLDYDALSLRGLTWRQTLERLGERTGWYDPEVLAALRAIAGVEAECDLLEVRVNELTNSMVIAEDIRTVTGMLIVSKGQEVTRSLRERLRNFATRSPIREPVRVLRKPQRNVPRAGAAKATAR